MQIFVFLDTNIWLRIATQGKPGCEKERWDELCKTAADPRVTIIVPEIVRMELSKHRRRFLEDFKLKHDKIDAKVAALTEESAWSEADDLLSAFKEKTHHQWETMKTDKIDFCQKGFLAIERWFGDGKFKDVPFTDAILFRAKRRLIEGRHVKKDSTSVPRDNRTRCERLLDGDNDLCIIESLAAACEEATDSELLFCTENLQDFCLRSPDDQKPFLHPVFRENLPKTEVFSDLASVVAFIKDNRPVTEPKPEVVEKAIKIDFTESEIQEWKRLKEEMDAERRERFTAELLRGLIGEKAKAASYDPAKLDWLPITSQTPLGAYSTPGSYMPDDDSVIVPFSGTYVRVPRKDTEVIKRLNELEIQRQKDIGKKLGD